MKLSSLGDIQSFSDALSSVCNTMIPPKPKRRGVVDWYDEESEELKELRLKLREAARKCLGNQGSAREKAERSVARSKLQKAVRAMGTPSLSGKPTKQRLPFSVVMQRPCLRSVRSRMCMVRKSP